MYLNCINWQDEWLRIWDFYITTTTTVYWGPQIDWFLLQSLWIAEPIKVTFFSFFSVKIILSVMTTWCHIPCMSWACCTNRKATLRRPLPLLKMPSKCFHPIQSPYSYSWFHAMKCFLLDDVLPQNQIIDSKGPDKNDYPRAKFGSNFNEHVQCCVVRYSKAPL